MSVSFEKYIETTLHSKDRGWAFDVRRGAKTDETQVAEIVQQLRDGTKIRLPFVDRDGILIDGRNAAEAYTRFLGGSNPSLPVYQFPWTYANLAAREQRQVENWALKQNLGSGAFRRLADFADQYGQIIKLVADGWTDAEIREEFRGSLNHSRITALTSKARTAQHNERAAAVRKVMKANPKLSPEKAVQSVGGGGTPEATQKLLRAAQTKAKPGTGKPKLRAHKFAGKMSGTVRAIQHHAQLLLDMFRENQDGRVGLTKERYIEELRTLQEKQRVISDAIDEIVRRALSEMGVPAEALDVRKKRRAA